MKLLRLRSLKLVLLITVILAVLFSMVAHPFAQTELRLPSRSGHVNDFARVVEEKTKQRLESILEEVKQKSGIEFDLATVETTGRQDIFSFSRQLARDWNVGAGNSTKKGLLLVVATNEKTMFVQFSKSVQRELPEGILGEMSQRMRALIGVGQFGEGISDGVQYFVSKLSNKFGFSLEEIDKTLAVPAVENPAQVDSPAAKSTDEAGPVVTTPIKTSKRRDEIATSTRTIASKRATTPADDEAEAEEVELTLTLPAANSSAKNSTTLKKTTESTKAISENPPSGAAVEAQKNYDAGMALYDSGKLNDAIAAFKQADRLKPDDPHTKYMLGMVYSKSKSYKDAADSFKQAVRFKPDWPEAHFKLGTMSYVLGRRSQSLEEYKKLLELDPTLANSLYGIIKEESNAEGRGGNVALESKVSAKQIEAVPVSASAKETPVPAGANSNRTAAGTKPVWTAPANPAPQSETPPGANLNGAAAQTKLVSTAPANPAPRSETNDPAPGLGSARAASEDSALTTIYKIGVGDVLDIRLLNSATSRSTLYTVIDGGLIDFPIAGGPVSVAGLTVDEIQARIASELKRRAVEEGAHVSVGVRQYASHTVIITGLVGNPGTKILRREAVPLYVIMADAQPRVDAGRLAIIRAGATEQFLDLSDPGALNFTVRPGDVINVTARPQEFYYIAGRINYPGQKVFQPGITLLQAILAAGGMTHENVNAIELSRERADGRLATTKFNLKEIKAGKVQDPRLQPGDRIEVVR